MVSKPGDVRLEGVADLRARTTLVKERMLSRDAAAGLRHATGHTGAILGAIAALGEAEMEMLYVGGSRYVRRSGMEWTAAEGGTGPDGPRCAEDPLWLLDGLAEPQAVEVIGHDVLDEPGATRIHGTIDLRAASDAFGVRLEQTPRLLDRLCRRSRVHWARAVPFAICVDGASLLRQIAYSTPPSPAGDVLWWTTELWDHGCPVELPRAPA